MDAENLLAERIRQGDRDRYLTALFAPAGLRRDLYALYAFNLEIARVADQVSDPMIGEIRLAWWRESMDGLYDGSPRRHEVLDALQPVIARHVLPREAFDRMIEARMADIEELPFGSLDDLDRYGAESAAPLIMLAAKVLGPWQPENSLAEAAGQVWTLAGILRSVGFHAHAGRVLLPRDLLLAGSIDAHDLVNGKQSAALQGVVQKIHGRAMEHLAAFLAGASTIPPAARPAFLPLALAVSDLRVIRAAGYDPFSPRLQAPRPGRLLGLMRRGLFGW